MKSKKYWIDRQKANQSLFIRDENKYLKKTASEYANHIRNNKTLISAFYGEYAKDGVIDYTTAIKRLTLPEMKELRKQINLEIDRIGRTNDTYLTYLKNMERQTKVSRIQQLKFNFYKSANQLTEWEQAEITAYLQSHYKLSYIQSIDMIEKGLGVKDLGALSQNKVRFATGTNWSGVHYSDRIWGQGNKLANSLGTVMQDQFIRQQHLSSTIKEMQHRFDVKFSDAERLVRTESSYISNEANKMAMEDAGLTKYQFVSADDERTSDICNDLDGKIFNISEAEAGTNYPPMHPNCRSTTIPAL